jgi:hypothetical protein
LKKYLQSERILSQQSKPIINKDLELQIKTLQNAPRDPDKLKRLLRLKERQKDEAMHMEDTQRLVIEIEMLKVVLHLMVSKSLLVEKSLKLRESDLVTWIFNPTEPA